MANAPNIGWKYYYDYFKGQEFRYILSGNQSDKETAQLFFSDKTQGILDLKWPDYQPFQMVDSGQKGFDLATTYPGLLIGSGYQHEVKVEGELKLGFSFDHTTGLPLIPGSSVKGALRAVWPVKNEEAPQEQREELREYVRWMIAEVNDLIALEEKSRTEGALCEGVTAIDGESLNIDHLELEIFEGVDIDKTIKEHGEQVLKSTNNKKKWIYRPASAKDVFYDAAITGAPDRFLGNDYITPHINRDKPELSPFTNPTPLQFLKVMPGVTFGFRFDLKAGLLSAAQKLLLFRQLLLTRGIGAKTNVGYGQFTADPPTHRYVPRPPGNLVQHIPTAANNELIKEADFEGEVKGEDNHNYKFEFTAGKSSCTVIKKKANAEKKFENKPLEIGQKVRIKINVEYTGVGPLNFSVLPAK